MLSDYMIYAIAILAILAVVLAVKKAVGCLVKTIILIVALGVLYYYLFL